MGLAPVWEQPIDNAGNCKWAPNNASKWQMGFNLAFKGLTSTLIISYHLLLLLQPICSLQFWKLKFCAHLPFCYMPCPSHCLQFCVRSFQIRSHTPNGLHRFLQWNLYGRTDLSYFRRRIVCGGLWVIVLWWERFFQMDSVIPFYLGFSIEA